MMKADQKTTESDSLFAEMRKLSPKVTGGSCGPGKHRMKMGRRPASTSF